MAIVTTPDTVNTPGAPRLKTILPTHWSLADLQAHLGGIPLERIRLYPPPGMATEEDALAINDRKEGLCELVDGILVEKVMASFESILAGILLQWINNFLDKHPLGVALAPDGALRILPKRMRLPDVSFISWDRFPDRKLPRDHVFRVAPDLAVEIISEGNTEAEMKIKLKEYFRAGVRIVWLIDPASRRARVYLAAGSFAEVDENWVMCGDPVLPGFAFRLGDLFDRVPRAEN